MCCAMVHLVVHLSWRGVFLSNGRHGRSVELGVVVASCTCWTCMYCTSEVMVGTNVESGIELSLAVAIHAYRLVIIQGCKIQIVIFLN